MSTITVAIVSYGYGHLIGHAIDSVLSQTRLPDDIIIVDDGAHDGVAQVADKFGLKAIVRVNNLGILSNFNDILINKVRTDKVMFLGADNWLRPDALEKMDLGYDIVSCHMAVTGSDAKNSLIIRRCVPSPETGYPIRRFKTYPNIAQRIMRSSVIHGSSLYNVSLARSVGGYEAVGEGKRLQEDWGLFRKMVKAGATHYNVDAPLLFYRRHGRNFLGVY